MLLSLADEDLTRVSGVFVGMYVGNRRGAGGVSLKRWGCNWAALRMRKCCAAVRACPSFRCTACARAWCVLVC